MKQIEADVIKAAARLHDAVLNKGPRSVEADIAVGEVVAAVDKVVNAKATCVTCNDEGRLPQEDKATPGHTYFITCPTCSD